MKIAYFIESLPPNIDGVSRTYRHLAESLLKKKGELDFVYFSPFKPHMSYLWTRYVIQVPWISIPFYKGYRLGIPRKKKLFEEIDSFCPDLIHCSSPSYLSFMALGYAKSRQIKAVASFHTDFASYLRYYKMSILDKVVWFYLRKFYSRFDVVFAPSRDTIEMLKAHRIDKVRLWQRGVDTKLFSPLHKNDDFREQLGAKNKPILLFVGRLEREKDIDDIIGAYRHLKERKLSFQIVFVGDGSMKRKLMQTLKEALLTGYKDKNELSYIYASSDIFIFPSTNETFGNVVQEALASGLPAIVVNKGGTPDLVNDKVNGFIAEPNNPKSFADKIELLLRDKALLGKMKENARLYSANQTWDNINLKLFEDYKEIVSNG